MIGLANLTILYLRSTAALLERWARALHPLTVKRLRLGDSIPIGVPFSIDGVEMYIKQSDASLFTIGSPTFPIYQIYGRTPMSVMNRYLLRLWGD